MATVSQAPREGTAAWKTHTVANQAPPLEGVDVFSSNVPLVEGVEREGAGWVRERASALGRFVGGEPQQLWGRQANENKPVLRTHDRYGNRIDEVEFHPAWHQLMTMGVEHELHSLPWTSEEPFAHTARAALYMTAMQAEAGFACPITMTFAVVPALRAQPELAAEWEPLLTATSYDPRLIPVREKGSALAGMAMTEKQGGSDVRANTTTARALNGGGAGAEYEISGHKWFCSAPMCDMFLVLAQTDEGLSCFLLPRILPDGTRNEFHIQRLKDKLGNHSNASSELELHGAWARMVGEPGRGVPTIIEMVGHTRLDCVIGTAAGMRDGRGQRHPSRRAPRGLRQDADRPAADAERARRPVPGVRGGHRACDAPGPRLRRGGRRCPGGRERDRRAAVQAPGDGRRQVLDVQARAQPRVRVARVPRRQRLRRGVRHAAPVPRGAAGLDLGGLGQRHEPRCPARADPLAAVARGLPR